VERCKLPLTGAGVVNTIVSDKGIFEPKGDHFSIRKLAPGVTADSLKIPLKLLKAWRPS
jgi:3-oxoacid CoA-transferase subunit B